MGSLEPIRNALRAERLGHAYLLYGDHPNKLRPQVTTILQGLVCEVEEQLSACGECRDCHQVETGAHPDLVILEAEEAEGQVSVDEIREEVVRAASLTPARAGHKLFWLQDIRRLTVEASNTLLKVLEEPPGEALFLLTARSRWDCMPTIRSRCHWVRIPRHESRDKVTPEDRVRTLWPDHDVPEDSLELTRDLLTNKRSSDDVDWSRDRARGFLTSLLLMINQTVVDSSPDVPEELSTRVVPDVLERFGELDRGVQPQLVVNSLLEELFFSEADPEWPVAS